MCPCTVVIWSSEVRLDNVLLSADSVDIPQRSAPVSSSSFGQQWR